MGGFSIATLNNQPVISLVVAFWGSTVSLPGLMADGELPMSPEGGWRSRGTTLW